eukprot:TRINITY_DN10185_c0_g1_i3.p1 TRINITY_DN10185_c0_g1~~TRINITY_DN10185_c0_g1_i3.p1  ORF type:complete len:151 (-),score=28.87 TRINITY_DN10185_c0_g1_i3:639-1091(-)
MGAAESFADFRSLSKLTLGLVYSFFVVQMLIFYWKNSLKAEGEVVVGWKGPLKNIAKAAHYEIIPSLLMFCVAIFVKSFNMSGVFLFFVSIIGNTLIVLGYHREKEGWGMLLLGRLLTHFATLAVLALAFFNAFAYGSVRVECFKCALLL